MEACIRSALETLQEKARRNPLSVQDIQSCLMDPIQLYDHELKNNILRQLQQSVENDKDDTDSFLRRIWDSYQQQQQAEKVFSLLDEAGKGVVVLHDLQRVVNDIMDEDVTEEDLVEMIHEFDQSGDGLLFREDIIRIARLVGLQE